MASFAHCRPRRVDPFTKDSMHSRQESRWALTKGTELLNIKSTKQHAHSVTFRATESPNSLLLDDFWYAVSRRGEGSARIASVWKHSVIAVWT